jgi:hypothetical protein
MVRSMRGASVDMARLSAENAHKIAIGNASMNARGDRIGPGGTVVKTHEQITSEYHTSNPKAVKQVALRNIQQEVLTPAEAVEELRKSKKRKLAE